MMRNEFERNKKEAMLLSKMKHPNVIDYKGSFEIRLTDKLK